MNKELNTAIIRALNDTFRQTGLGGRELITIGIQELGLASVSQLRRMIAEQNDFSEGSDPYQEHDFGSLLFRGQRVFWKIDYYGLTLDEGSPDPFDPAVTTRVLTIMLACEY